MSPVPCVVRASLSSPEVFSVPVPLAILATLLQLLLGDQSATRAAAAEALEELADEVLARRIRGGDEAAFRVVLSRHAAEIHAFLRRRVADEATAEDLTQETFVRLCTADGGWRPGTSLRAWLHRVARNLVIDRSRRAEARHGHDADATLLGSIAAGDAAPDEEAGRSELRTRLRRGLAELSDTQRELVLMRHDEGLSFPEIAEILEVPVGTVKSRMRHALLHLRGSLPEWEPGAGGEP